ncbi:MAG: hypothetical protein KAH77_06835 [Thiomargarita sp.]|nr:hypothetical protein [Thiomargarita sp.]
MFSPYWLIINITMNILKSHVISMITFFIVLMVVLLSCTSEEERMKQHKSQAVSKAWAQESKLVKLGHAGTHQWSHEERIQLLKEGKVTGYEGWYINKYVDDNLSLATDSNNIFFAEEGSASIPELKTAALRSYLIKYEQNKYLLWGGTLSTIVVLIMAFKSNRGVITYPAIAGASLGGIKLGIISGGSFFAILAGLASGLIIGTLAGIFLFLMILSVGVG